MTAISPAEVRVDQSALRTNQAFIIALLLGAFLLAEWRLVAFVSAVLLIGTALPSLSLFKTVYLLILKPAGLVRPDIKIDDPAPHRFAQGVGGLVTAAAALSLAGGWRAAGWALTWVVILLAALNLSAGICVGCLLFFQLRRLVARGTSSASELLP